MDICAGISAPTAAWKPCAKCGESKPLDQFHKAGKRGHHSWCKQCFNAYGRETRNRKVTPEQRKRNNLWTRYRLTPKDVDLLLTDQGGVCAICNEAPQYPAIDHDHESGEVRGILCKGCNAALSAVEDAVWLRAALLYLGRKP